MKNTITTLKLAIFYEELLKAGIVNNLEEFLKLIKLKKEELKENLKKNI